MKQQRIQPGPGQESVWDYPRPPRLEDCASRLRVVVADVTLADTTHAKRVLETSHPPVYYFPPEDVDWSWLRESTRRTQCEWKGEARYYSIVVANRVIPDAAWCYPRPSPHFARIVDHLAFYPSKMDACHVDDELATAQEGDFYGGWITSKIVGPFKGAPGTMYW